MKMIIDRYGMSPHRLVAGTVGSYGFETLEAEFSPEWEGLGKKVIFCPADGSAPVQVAWQEGGILLPAEVYRGKGICRFSVVGYREEKLLATVTGELLVLDTLPTEAENAVAPTPTEIAQVFTMMQQAVTSAGAAANSAGAAEDAAVSAEAATLTASGAAEQAAGAAERAQAAASAAASDAHIAAQTASALRADADAGLFDGATPEISPAGTWQINGTDTGVPARPTPLDDNAMTTRNVWSAQKIAEWSGAHFLGAVELSKEGNVICRTDHSTVGDGFCNILLQGQAEKDEHCISPLDACKFSKYGMNLLDPAVLESGTISADTGALSPNGSRCRTGAIPLPRGVYYWKNHIPAKTHFYDSNGVWKSSVRTEYFRVEADGWTIRAVWTNSLAETLAARPVLAARPDVPAELYKNPEVVSGELPVLYGFDGYYDTLELRAKERIALLTRRVGVLVFTGSENWALSGSGRFTLVGALRERGADDTVGLCSHYAYLPGAGSVGSVCISGQSVIVSTSDAATVSAWKSWLTMQNMLGTPFTVLYPLAQPEVCVEDTSYASLFDFFELPESFTLLSECPVTLSYRVDGQAFLSALERRISILEDVMTSES